MQMVLYVHFTFPFALLKRVNMLKRFFFFFFFTQPVGCHKVFICVCDLIKPGAVKPPPSMRHSDTADWPSIPSGDTPTPQVLVETRFWKYNLPQDLATSLTSWHLLNT